MQKIIEKVKGHSETHATILKRADTETKLMIGPWTVVEIPLLGFVLHPFLNECMRS